MSFKPGLLALQGLPHFRHANARNLSLYLYTKGFNVPDRPYNRPPSNERHGDGGGVDALLGYAVVYLFVALPRSGRYYASAAAAAGALRAFVCGQ
jgi:hypothetical protein